MLLTPDALRDLLGTVALMALLAVAYGTVMRALARPAAAQVALGALFGGAAALSTLHPIHVADGAVVDLHVVPLVLAGAFLGISGAATATLVALGARFDLAGGLGIEGAAAGAAGIVVPALVGLAWARLVQRLPRATRRGALAVLSLLGLPALALLPGEAALAAAWPFVTPFDAAAVLIVGALLARERLVVDKERRLGQAAARDQLTGLLNRRGFEAEVAPLLRGRRGAALLVLDLDHFKRVNDTLGHATGDVVLHSLAARLGGACRRKDVVARFGGEEMVVFLPRIDLQGAQDAAARLCEVVRAKPFVLPSGRRLAVTASVGGAWTGGRVSLDRLMARADVALYAAKDAGRNRWRFDVDGALAGAHADLAEASLHRTRRTAAGA
jgi:diguanylate cyclase